MKDMVEESEDNSSDDFDDFWAWTFFEHFSEMNLMSSLENETDTTESSGESADVSDSFEPIKDYKYYKDNNLLASEDAKIKWEILEKEIRQLPRDYVRALQVNSVFFYLPIFFIIGPVVWYLTTFPERAALQPMDPTLENVIVPFNISISAPQTIVNDVERLFQDLSGEWQLADFRLKFVQENVVMPDYFGLAFVDAKDFKKRFPNERSDIMGKFVENNVLVLKVVDHVHDLKQTIEDVLGLERLKTIVKTDGNTLQVFVFLHELGARAEQVEAKLWKEAQKFLIMANKYGMHSDLSAEHLWDFNVDEFVSTDRKTGQRTVRNDRIEALATEVDKYTTWTSAKGVDKPIIKVAVFCTADELTFVSEKSVTNGMVVASWGGVTSIGVNSEDQHTQVGRAFSALVDIVHGQLGVQPLTRSTKVSYPASKLPAEYEWGRFHHQAFLEHVVRGRAAIRAIHDLKHKLEYMVVTRDIAVHVYESHEVLVQTLLEARVHGKMDVNKAIRARLLSERASTHKDVLQFMDFPWDQRYAMYVPFFLPIYSNVFGHVRILYALVKVWLMVKLERLREGPLVKILPFW